MLLTGVLTILYCAVPNVFDLVNYYSFMYWLTVGLSIVGQIYLRYSQPDRKRPIKFKSVFQLFSFFVTFCNFSIGLPILFCVLCTVLIIVPCVTETTDTLIGCGLLVLGFIPYKLWLNQNYMPGFLKSAANGVERIISESLLFHHSFNINVTSQNYSRIAIIAARCAWRNPG